MHEKTMGVCKLPLLSKGDCLVKTSLQIKISFLSDLKQVSFPLASTFHTTSCCFVGVSSMSCYL